jgi:hypothetical protein
MKQTGDFHRRSAAVESNWLWQAAQSHQAELMDEAARYHRLGDGDAARLPVSSGWRRWTALRLRRIADRLEPSVQPQLGVLRAVAHHEVDVEQALRLLGPARRVSARH